MEQEELDAIRKRDTCDERFYRDTPTRRAQSHKDRHACLAEINRLSCLVKHLDDMLTTAKADGWDECAEVLAGYGAVVDAEFLIRDNPYREGTPDEH